ncbi:3-oxoadipate enol-lactonase [Rhodovastum atsumiense]|uniref:3-oxoadipate enol-lactonase n=1 Tax=Rhodovastum atsumiense TaxID=504468 RepID=A0A5M6IS75_9PROT|nr:3-oxoadipate enol-lactonase [Rhodovastum atsumiense]KAA5611082.1 3-oxoadipate enol-lactonase [Rhodovastum atsumiense]CAH2599142.1 3-oxoadipate enol-lactonase [Rhodovastum atsumiense]
MFLRTGDLDIHVQVSGPPGAPALLMLHSLGTTLQLWDGAAEALSGGFRVIRPDLRGHGLSGVTPGPTSIDILARDALAVLDALGVGMAHVCGISIGGMVAQSLAAQAPGRVASLILVDTALALPPPETWRERAALVRAHGIAGLVETIVARWVTPGFLDAPATHGLRRMLLRTPAEGYAAAAEALATADLTAGTTGLAVPALILVGEHDQSTPLASARALQQAIPGASLEVLPGTAHLPPAEAPDLVSSALLRFLAPAVADPLAAGTTGSGPSRNTETDHRTRDASHGVT